MNRQAADFEYMSFDEFEEALADKPRNERWELIGGRVVRLMVGARWEHATIVQNLAKTIGIALDASNSSCLVFTETFYMKQKALDAALLPDVMVVCGGLEPGTTSTGDPLVLVEVLSVGSTARDRFEKWAIYQRLRSLRHYVLVEQNRPHAEVYDREGESWTGLRIVDGIEATLHLPTLDLSIPLAEIYRRVL